MGFHQTEPRINLSFLLFLLGSFGMISIYYTSITFTPLYVLELGGSQFDAGLQNALFLITSVVFRFYFGPLGDSRGRRIPLLIGAVVFATTPLLFYWSDSVSALLAARLYEAVGAGAFLNTAASVAADFASPRKIGIYMAGMLCLYPLSLLIAPITADFVLAGYGFSGTFLVAFLLGIVFAAILFVNQYPQNRNPQDRGELKHILARLLEAISYKPVWLMLWGIVFVYLCLGAILTYVPVYASQMLHFDNAGLYFSYLGFTGVIGILITGYLSDRFGREKVIIPALILYSISIILFYFVPAHPGFYTLSGLMVGLGAYASSGIFQQWIVAVTEERIRATMMALSVSIIDLSFAVGAFIVGLVSGLLSIGDSLTILGLSVMVFALYLLHTLRSDDKIVARD